MLPDPRYPPLCWPFAYVWQHLGPWFPGHYPDHAPGGAPLLGHGKRVVPRQSDFIRLASGGGRYYGILADGSLWGWGSPPLGDGTLDSQPVPKKISDGPWKDVATEGNTTVAIKQDGSLWGWGDNRYGQLGLGSRSPAPVEFTLRPMLNAAVSHVSLPAEIVETREFNVAELTSEPVFFIEKSVMPSGDDPTAPGYDPGDPGDGCEITTDYRWAVASVEPLSPSWFDDDGADYLISVVDDGSQGEPDNPAVVIAVCEYRVKEVTFPPGASVAGDVQIIFQDGVSTLTTAEVANNGDGSFTLVRSGHYSSRPTFRFVGRASASPTVKLERRIASATVVSGGEYATRQLRVDCPYATVSSDSLGLKAVVYGCEVTSPGFGYTSKASKPLTLAMKIGMVVRPGDPPDRHHRQDVGEIVLTPGAVSSLKQSFFEDAVPVAMIAPFSVIRSRSIPAYRPSDITAIDRSNDPAPSARLIVPGLDPTELKVIPAQGEPGSFQIELEEAVCHPNVGQAVMELTYPPQVIANFWPPGKYPADGQGRPAALPVAANATLVGWTLYDEQIGLWDRQGWSMIHFGYVTMPGEQSPYAATGCWQAGIDFPLSRGWLPGDARDFPLSAGWLSRVTGYVVDVGLEVVRFAKQVPLRTFQQNSELGGVSQPGISQPPYIVTARGYSDGQVYWPEFVQQETSLSLGQRVDKEFVTAFTGGSRDASLTDVYRHHGGQGFTATWGYDSPNDESGKQSVTFSVSSTGSGYRIEPEVTATTMILSPVAASGGQVFDSITTNGRCTAGVCGGKLYACGGGAVLSYGGLGVPGANEAVRPWIVMTEVKAEPLANINAVLSKGREFTVKSRLAASLPSQTVWDGVWSNDFYFGSPPGFGVQDGYFNQAGARFFKVTAGVPGGLAALFHAATPTLPYTREIFSDPQYVPGDSGQPAFGDVTDVFSQSTGDSSETKSIIAIAGGHLWVVDPSPIGLAVIDKYDTFNTPYGNLQAVQPTRKIYSFTLDGFSAVPPPLWSQKAVVPSGKLADGLIDVYGAASQFDVTWKWKKVARTLSVLTRGGHPEKIPCVNDIQTVNSPYIEFDEAKDSSSSSWQKIASVHAVPVSYWRLVLTSGGSGYKKGGTVKVRVSGGKFWYPLPDPIGSLFSAGVELNVVSPVAWQIETQSLSLDKLIVSVSDHPEYEEKTIGPFSAFKEDGPPTGGPNGEVVFDLMSFEDWTAGRVWDCEGVEYEKEEVSVTVGKSIRATAAYSTKAIGFVDCEGSAVGEGPGFKEFTVGYQECLGTLVSIDIVPILSPPPIQGRSAGDYLLVAEGGSVQRPSVEIISTSGGAGATAEFLPVLDATTVPYCLTQPHSAVVSGSVTAADWNVFNSGGGLYWLGSQTVPLPDKCAAGGFSSLSPGVGIAGGARAYATSSIRAAAAPYYSQTPTLNSLPVPRTLNNIEFRIASEGKTLTTLPRISLPQPSTNVARLDFTYNGKVVGVGVIDGGSGFTSPPTVTVGGQTSVAEAVISGPVAKLSLTVAGSGYAAPPRLVFDGAGKTAAASCEIDDRGRVTGTSVQNGGTYRQTPTVSFEPSPVVASVSVSSGGQYSRPPAVILFGGSGSGAAADCIIDGAVHELALVSGGSGYVDGDPPDVEFVGDCERPAAATAIVAGGTVVSVLLSDGGSMYQEPPFVRFVRKSGSGGDARATAKIRGPVDTVRVRRRGSGYDTPPEVRFSGHGFGGSATAQTSTDQLYMLDGVTLTSGGQYSAKPRVAFVGGGGVGAVAECTLDGAVTQVVLSDGGAGYESPPDVVFLGECDTPATATAQIADGRVIAVSVLSAGSGYQSPPLVSFTGGFGGAGLQKPATGTSRILGPIKSVTLLATGNGFYGVPTVEFQGGVGSGATATADTTPPEPAAATAVINGSVLFCKIKSQSSDYEFSPAVTATATSQNNYLVADDASLAQKVSPKLEARIAGRVTDVTVGVVGEYYVTDIESINAKPPDKIAVEADVNFGHGTVEATAADGAVTGISPEELDKLPEFPQKPFATFPNSMRLNVERVRNARRTAISVRNQVKVPPASPLQELLDRHGASYTRVNITGIKSFWSSRFMTTASGKRFRLVDIPFAVAPEFEVDDPTGTGLTVSCTIDNSGYITELSVSGTPQNYTSHARLRLVSAKLGRFKETASCTLTGGGVDAISAPGQDSKFLSPVAVVYGDGSGAAADVVLYQGGGAMAVRAVVVRESGRGYTNAAAAIVEETDDFLATEHGEALAASLASLAIESVFEFDEQYLEHASLGVKQYSYPVSDPNEVTLTTTKYFPSLRGYDFVSLYSPVEFQFPQSGDGYDEALLGKKVNIVDYYAVCDAIETLSTQFDRDRFFDEYQSAPQITVEGCGEELPVIEAELVQWEKAFEAGGIRE